MPRRLKRAGLDYWPAVCCQVHATWGKFYEYYESQAGPKQLVGFTKLGRQHYAADGLYHGPSTWLLCERARDERGGRGSSGMHVSAQMCRLCSNLPRLPRLPCLPMQTAPRRAACRPRRTPPPRIS